jgi:hypothetical protein
MPIDIYLEFYRKTSAELESGGLSARDERVSRAALMRYMDWLTRHAGDPSALSATNPWEVYGQIHTPLLIADIKTSSREAVLAESRKKQQAEHSAAVKAKLDEYWTWAMARWQEASNEFKHPGRAYLITEHRYRRISMNALTDAVLSWAHANTEHPDFLRRSPNETAVLLMAENRALATVVEIGRQAQPRLEYFPELDRTRQTLGETAFEVLIGLLPILGEAQDASDAITGVSITGHPLGTGDRFVAGLCLIIPLVPGAAFRTGDEMLQIVSEVATRTGRSIDEVESIFRVAGNLDQTHARHLERIMDDILEAKHLTDADLDILDDIAKRLKGPLEELGQAKKAGGTIPTGKLHVDPTTGQQLVPGDPRHASQRWLEYQVRHPDRFPRLTTEIDPDWLRQYNTIIQNKRAGGAFESGVIDWLSSSHHPGMQKNTAIMMDPGSKTAGFIPDGVKGNPAELVWGTPYHFVEVKGWKEMSNTGNLKAMMEYVHDFGGHIEVVFRSAKHPQGKTRLTGPMEEALDDLQKNGLATIRYHPP